MILFDFREDQKHRDTALTLLELIVTVSILTVLTSLLMGALSHARGSADTMVCLSNLKQLGLACQLYAEANDDRLPYPNDAFGYSITWFNALDPHLLGRSAANNNAEQNLHLVKQDPVIKTLGPSWVSNAYTIKMNRRLGEGYPNGQRFYTLHEISNPSLTVLLFDGRAETEKLRSGEPAAMAMNPQGTEGFVARRHSNRANVLFVDGHVELRDEKKELNGGLGWAIDQTRLIWKPWTNPGSN